MPTSAAGSKPPSRHGGFTMIELLVVVTIIAIGSAGVVFAIRDSAVTQLEREAQRLAALFEAARAQSRASGQPVRWQPVEGGFRFDGAVSGTMPQGWLSGDVQVQGTPVLLLGPEPIIGPQSVVLRSTAAPDHPLRVATDGLRPFQVSGTGS